MLLHEPRELPLELLDVVVARGLQGHAQERRRSLQARVCELVDDHGVARLDEHGERRDMGQRSRRSDKGVPTRHRPESLLQLFVERRLQIRSRNRKLRTVPADGVYGSLSKLRTLIEVEVRARPEVEELRATYVNETIELCHYPASGPVQVQADLTHLAFEVDSLEEFGKRIARWG